MTFGIAGLERQVDRAGVSVLEQHLLPVPAAVARAEHAAFGIRAVWMAERGDVDDVGVVRIHEDLADLLRVAQADMRPAPAAVGGFVYAVALGDVRAHVGFAAAGVDDLRVGRRDRDRADRADRLRIEDRLPGSAGVAGLPDAAVDGAEIVMARIARHAGHRQHAAAAERTDRAPMQVAEKAWIDCRLGSGGNANNMQGEQVSRTHA